VMRLPERPRSDICNWVPAKSALGSGNSRMRCWT